MKVEEFAEVKDDLMKVFAKILTLEKQMFDLKPDKDGNFDEFSLNIIAVNQEIQQKVKGILEKSDFGLTLTDEIKKNENLTAATISIEINRIDMEDVLNNNWKKGNSNPESIRNFVNCSRL